MDYRTAEDQVIRYRAFAGMVGEATNVGVTGDELDVYDVFDTLISDMSKAMPPVACRNGCNQCCYHPPLVTSLEWSALYPHLLNLSPVRQELLIEQADALRPLTKDLGALRRRVLGADRAEAIGDFSMQCPMLIDGKCAVYAGRPLVCRGYGQTLRISGDKSVFFGSNLAFAHMRENFPEDTALPLFDPYVDRISALNEASAGTEAFLPQWLWAHIENNAFVPEAIIRPAF
ncbi:MAG: YkgJ family cysteine cluster protein [Candidatus Sericytochromatia bacterium]|nr:YkgJ family cysteine cluster protein [Candidatus Sericytochromatia bacterium]